MKSMNKWYAKEALKQHKDKRKLIMTKKEQEKLENYTYDKLMKMIAKQEKDKIEHFDKDKT